MGNLQRHLGLAELCYCRLSRLVQSLLGGDYDGFRGDAV